MHNDVVELMGNDKRKEPLELVRERTGSVKKIGRVAPAAPGTILAEQDVDDAAMHVTAVQASQD